MSGDPSDMFEAMRADAARRLAQGPHGSLGEFLSEMTQGIVAYLVDSKTQCGKDAAVSYAHSVMIESHGNERPSASGMYDIITEAVDLAGGESGVQ